MTSSVTCLAWKPKHEDLLCSGHGDLKFVPESSQGSVAFWSIKHPEEPQWSFQTPCGPLDSLLFLPDVALMDDRGHCCGVFQNSVQHLGSRNVRRESVNLRLAEQRS